MSDGAADPGSKNSAFLEFYRITLEHRAKLVSIIMVSGIAVAIPAAVDAYKARLDLYAKDKSLEIERVIKDRETALKVQEQKLNELQFRQNSIQAFSSTGLQQDIELRIRLAEYFAALSDDEYKAKWNTYRLSLTERRENTKRLLDDLNDRIDIEEIKSQPDTLKLRKLYRAKRWLEAEFNPVEPSEKVTLRSGSGQLPSNEGLTLLTMDYVLSVLGPPLADMKLLGNSCRAIDNDLLGAQMKTDALSIGKVIMLEPALASLKDVLANIAKRESDLAAAIKNMGTVCVRKIRNGNELSRHSFGLAIDLSVRDKMDLSPDVKDDFQVVAEEFHKAGWIWGGAWTMANDYPHFEVSQQLLDAWINSGKIAIAKP